MRKIKLLWFIAAILSVCVFSCDDKEGDGDKGGTGGGGGGGSTTTPANVLEEEYFVIEGATFVNEDLPTGSDDLITDIYINSNAINGGSSIVTIVSEEELKKAFIGIEGVKGYYEYELEQSVLAKSMATASYSYDIVLLINQDIKVTNFSLSISVETVDGRVSKENTSDEVNIIEVGNGDLQISLYWDQFDDVDLHVIEPDGNHIYYGDRYSVNNDWDEDDVYFYFLIYIVEKYTTYNVSGLNPEYSEDWDTLYDLVYDMNVDWDESHEFKSFIETGNYVKGYLDVDSNAACNIDKINNENIFFINPMNGEYKIYVDLYSKCDDATPGAKYSVTVKYLGQNIKISDIQIGQFDDHDLGSGDWEERYVYIGSFNLDDTRTSSQPVKEKRVSDNPYVQKLKNRLFTK